MLKNGYTIMDLDLSRLKKANKIFSATAETFVTAMISIEETSSSLKSLRPIRVQRP